MEKSKKLSNEKKEILTNKLWRLESALNGLGAVFQCEKESIFNSDELYGIGNLMKILSSQIAEVENELRQY